MKPIFNEEKKFLEERLELELPSECWRDGKKIYLNADKDTLIIQFQIDKKKLIVKKNKIQQVLDKYKNKTWQEEIEENKDRLDQLMNESIQMTLDCMNKYPNHNWRISDSSGKDSAVCNYICQRAMEIVGKFDYDIDFFNTSNDVADTYLLIKKNIRNTIEFQLKNTLKREPSAQEIEERYNEVLYKWIHNPEMGWYQWLKEVKNYYLPSVMVRNCCSTYKEGKLKQVLDKKSDCVLFLGMRKYESTRRQHYDWYLNEAMDKMYEKTGMSKYKLNMPRNWVRFLPIVNWRDEDIWLFIMRENIEVNAIYYKGFSRAGCLICPMSSDYNDLLVEYWYPAIWKRWGNIVEINYDTYNRGSVLKWTKEEYVNDGKWKTGVGKIQEIITKKATPERIKEVADILGVSEEVAEKYFKQTCSCGKKLNPDEIAMYLKLYGRYEGYEDDRTYLCKDCLCKEQGITKDEYSEMVRDFRNKGCELF